MTTAILTDQLQLTDAFSRSPSHAPAGSKQEFQRRLAEAVAASPVAPETRLAEPIPLGSISPETPTVSHILANHPDYRRDCWQIIHSAANCDKPYQRMPQGELVLLNPNTRELIWESLKTAGGPSAVAAEPGADRFTQVRGSAGLNHAALAANADRSPQDPSLSQELATKIKSYLGTAYDELDCYQLVIQGLRDMGVRYGGKTGLQSQLIHRAGQKGLPLNAFLTGAGIIAEVGERVFEYEAAAVTEPETEATELIDAMADRLEPGLMISFHLGNKGHVGVISQHQGVWTLLNSGLLNHDVHQTNGGKGVGEENLRQELSAWMRRAKANRQTLKILIGKLAPEKLAAFMPPMQPICA